MSDRRGEEERRGLGRKRRVMTERNGGLDRMARCDMTAQYSYTLTLYFSMHVTQTQ